MVDENTRKDFVLIMFKLSLTTSGQYISAAIFEQKLVSSSIFKSDKGSTSLLLNQIDELFKKTGIQKKI